MTFGTVRHIQEVELDPPHPSGNPTLEIIEWRARFGSELVLCDGEGIPLTDLPPRVAVPDVDFTAFVSWAGFDPADVHLADTGHETYLPVLTQIRSLIESHFSNRAREQMTEADEERKTQPTIAWPVTQETPHRAQSPVPAALERESAPLGTSSAVRR